MTTNWSYESSKIVENLTGALANASLALRHMDELQRKSGSAYVGKEIENTRGLYNALGRELDELVAVTAVADELEAMRNG